MCHTPQDGAQYIVYICDTELYGVFGIWEQIQVGRHLVWQISLIITY